MVEIVKRSIRHKKRTIAYNQGFQEAKQAIGIIYSGMELYGITAGQFHFINIVEHLVEQVREPMALTVASWTIAKFETSRLAIIKACANVERLRIVVDSSMLNLVPTSFNFLKDLIGDDSIRFLRCHCKFAVFTSCNWNIVVRTSMNLNQNKRLENFEISDCKVLSEYMTGIVDSIFATPYDRETKVRIAELGKDETVDEFDRLMINISDFDTSNK